MNSIEAIAKPRTLIGDPLPPERAPTVQTLQGHSDVRTTKAYTQCSAGSTTSPLDAMLRS